MNYLIAFTVLVLTTVLFPGRGQTQRFIEDITDFSNSTSVRPGPATRLTSCRRS